MLKRNAAFIGCCILSLRIRGVPKLDCLASLTLSVSLPSLTQSSAFQYAKNLRSHTGSKGTRATTRFHWSSQLFMISSARSIRFRRSRKLDLRNPLICRRLCTSPLFRTTKSTWTQLILLLAPRRDPFLCQNHIPDPDDALIACSYSPCPRCSPATEQRAIPRRVALTHPRRTPISPG